MTMSTKQVLACVDASPYMQSVCSYASWVSQSLAAPIHVLHVRAPYQNLMLSTGYPEGMSMAMSSALIEEYAQLERDHNKFEQQQSAFIVQKAQSLLQQSTMAVEVSQPVGSLVDTINELASHTSMIVIGKRGEQAGYATGHLGSNLERVVRAAHAPVLVAAIKFVPVNRIAIAYDGGANANLAIDYVMKHSMFANVQCHLIGVGPEYARNELHLTKAAGMLRQTHHDVHVHYEDGMVDDVLGNYIGAHNIDMLLMGAYSHSSLRNLFIGSSTNAMLQSCPVSVMLFR